MNHPFTTIDEEMFLPRNPHVGVSENNGTQNGWFIRENPIRIDDLGYPYFRKPPCNLPSLLDFSSRKNIRIVLFQGLWVFRFGGKILRLLKPWSLIRCGRIPDF